MSAEGQRLIARRWTSHARTTLGYIGPDNHFVPIGDIDGHGQPSDASEAHASRLVAAWNACYGLPLDEIGLLATYRNLIEAQRADLLLALQGALKSMESGVVSPDAICAARAAITKVTGKPA